MNYKLLGNAAVAYGVAAAFKPSMVGITPGSGLEWAPAVAWFAAGFFYWKDAQLTKSEGHPPATSPSTSPSTDVPVEAVDGMGRWGGGGGVVRAITKPAAQAAAVVNKVAPASIKKVLPLTPSKVATNILLPGVTPLNKALAPVRKTIPPRLAITAAIAPKTAVDYAKALRAQRAAAAAEPAPGPGEPEIEYYDAVGNKITKEQYLAALDQQARDAEAAATAQPTAPAAPAPTPSQEAVTKPGRRRGQYRRSEAAAGSNAVSYSQPVEQSSMYQPPVQSAAAPASIAPMEAPAAQQITPTSAPSTSKGGFNPVVAAGAGAAVLILGMIGAK